METDSIFRFQYFTHDATLIIPDACRLSGNHDISRSTNPYSFISFAEASDQT